MKALCRLCAGSGALDQVTMWYQTHPVDEDPVHHRSTRIICPRCDGEGRYGHDPKDADDERDRD